MRADLRVVEDPAGEAARLMAAVDGHMVITGGSTPREAYVRLAAMRDDWSGVELWLTDERCVPPDHEHANFRMIKESLIDAVDDVRYHRMRGELGPREGADDYERQLGDTFGDELPAFDLMLLGLGPDAHTCSLFPGDDALGERERRAVGVERPGMAPLVPRITLTLPVVNAARHPVFLVTGEDKAEAMARAFAGPPDPSAPASLLDDGLTVICDAAAASRL